ncbi:MAG: GDP-mannose 4,6-dehydratase [Melioribacteraceae bacterium]|nr:GDP-mannose 4,6-dehydratase [Melioribacteraceae bacterium]
MRNEILITGGAGFIGSYLCERLVQMNWNVVCLDNFDPFYPREFKLRNIENIAKSSFFSLIEGDLQDKNLIKEIFDSHKIVSVVHLAAQAGVRESIMNPEKYFATNVLGSLNLLNVIKDKNIEKFIYASSSSVYGNNKKIPFSEDDPILAPASPYAASKIAAESLCATYSSLYKIPTICLRFFTVYGPRQRPDMAFSKFIKNAINSGIIEIYGDGSSSRDYTFIDDIIDGIIRSLEFSCDYEIFNLGNSTTIKLEEVIRIIGSTLHKDIVVKRIENQLGDVPVTYADIRKAETILGYKPQTNIENGIKKYIDWYRTSF